MEQVGTLLNNDGTEVVKTHQSLLAARSTWDSHWNEIAKFVIPRKDNVYGQHVKGEKAGNELFDTTAIQANDDLSSAMHGLMVNPSIQWFGLETGEQEIDEDEASRKWLFDSTLTTINVMNQSNFQTEIHEVFQDLGSIGTASLRIEADDEEVVRYFSEPIYEVALRENAKGVIDCVSREYEFDGRQIMDEFHETMSEKTKKLVEDKTKSDASFKFKIIQRISKRTRYEMTKGVGSTAMPVKSVHVLVTNSDILRESGFEEWPMATPRWSKINVETYGRSPAMKALADIKMSNSYKKVVIQGAQLAIAPPLQVPDNGFLSPLQVKPFGTNYYRSGSKDRIEPLFVGANPQLGEELLTVIHEAIKKHFLIDKLITIQSDRMTATEVLQRRDEQLRFLGPQLGRLDKELLKPIVDRTFAICARAGLFKPIPEKLAAYIKSKGGNIELLIRYKSTIAQAQLITQSENIVRAINSTAFVVGSQPEVMDNIDGDKLLKHNMQIYGVNPKVLRPEAEVRKIRETRAEQQQQMVEQAQANQGADTIQKLGKADAEQPR